MEDKKSVGQNLPYLGMEGPDLDFRGWNLAFRTYVRSLTTSDVNLFGDAAPPPPLDRIAIAHLQNANARRVAEAEREVSLSWHNGRRLPCLLQ